jgi:hypothetical protein
MKLKYLLFPLLALMARAPGKKDACMVTLIVMAASIGLWAAFAVGVTKVLV